MIKFRYIFDARRLWYICIQRMHCDYNQRNVFGLSWSQSKRKTSFYSLLHVISHSVLKWIANKMSLSKIHNNSSNNKRNKNTNIFARLKFWKGANHVSVDIKIQPSNKVFSYIFCAWVFAIALINFWRRKKRPEICQCFSLFSHIFNLLAWNCFEIGWDTHTDTQTVCSAVCFWIGHVKIKRFWHINSVSGMW